ncbi:MAG: PTS sugar transporter subunit IIA, partial [Myxococcota bacterium]|nr:PTS sugar transporter subunit IIA [Myxococcota bacterium]
QWYKPTYRSPFYPWVPILGVIMGGVLLAMMGWLSVVALVAVLLPSFALYAVYARKLEDRVGVLGRLLKRQEILDESPPVSVPAGVDMDDALPENAAVAVPIFGHERSPETLVSVATAIADGAKVEVVHLTGVPEQMNLEDMLEDGPVVTSLRRRISSLADEGDLDLTFDSVVTRDVLKSVHHVTSRVHCEWLVMEWRGPTERGFLQTNPIGWLVDHLPCNMALFKDAGIRSIREILVLAEPGPNDGLVVETADHLAEVYGARVTFARYVHSDASPMTLQAESDFVDQLAQMCPSPHGTLVLQGKDFEKTVVGATAAYDLMVMSVPHEESRWSRLMGTAKDRITRKAACSVLKLQTGLDMEVAKESSPTPSPSFRLGAHVEPACVRVGLRVSHQRELFSIIADTFAECVPGVTRDEVEDALWEREETQASSIGDGVAMPHATLNMAGREYLGVFVLSNPVFFEADADDAVDVCFVTLDPPSERKKHPMLLAHMEQLLAETDVLKQLREATDTAAVMQICQDAELK